MLVTAHPAFCPELDSRKQFAHQGPSIPCQGVSIDKTKSGQELANAGAGDQEGPDLKVQD